MFRRTIPNLIFSLSLTLFRDRENWAVLGGGLGVKFDKMRKLFFAGCLSKRQNLTLKKQPYIKKSVRCFEVLVASNVHTICPRNWCYIKDSI
jgi:hypothetical protein